MEDELYKLEELSLVNKVTQEIFNFTGNHDKTLAEFVIAVRPPFAHACPTVDCSDKLMVLCPSTQLHRKSKKFDVFQSKLNEVGAPFPDSFVHNLDRIILAMHPKYKKKAKKAAVAALSGTTKAKEGGTDGVADPEADRKARMFPGLALADTNWKPIDKFIEEERGAGPIVKDVDDLMKELEGVAAKKNARPSAADFMDGGEDAGPSAKRQRTDNGYDRGGRESNGRERERGRSPPPQRDNGYGGRGGYGGGDRGGYQNARGRPALDDKPVLYKIYNGKVSSIKDFGAFVSLDGIQGRAEGEYEVGVGVGAEKRERMGLYPCTQAWSTSRRCLMAG